MQFFLAVAIMQWTAGDRCLQNFERPLQGSYLSDWTQGIDATKDAAPTQPPIHDMGFFIDAVGNFMANIFDNRDWTEQADYI
jgi:hypothetical protein